MELVVIGSHESKLELVCGERRSDRAEVVHARVRGPGFEGTRSVEEFDGYEQLGCFFEGMAEHWRGWEGEKRYYSLEGDLELVARHDGHVRLVVRLRQVGPSEWTLTARLTVDPGEDLKAAAREVRALVGPAPVRGS